MIKLIIAIFFKIITINYYIIITISYCEFFIQIVLFYSKT